MSGEPIIVTATDPATGDTETVELAPGNYMITCAAPCHVAHEQIYSNGTVQVTIKRRREEDGDV